MPTVIYIVTLTALVAVSLMVPGLVGWAALAAAVTTGVWLCFSLRDVLLDRAAGAPELEDGSPINFRSSTSIDDGPT